MNRPHVIIQNYNILQIIQFGARRGKEGIAEMKVKNFGVQEDEIWGHKFWAKQASEVTKNHPDDAETIENCGQIPFIDILVSH